MRILTKQKELEAIQWTGTNAMAIEDFVDDVAFRDIVFGVPEPVIECYAFTGNEYRLVNLYDYIVYDSELDRVYIYHPDEFEKKFSVI